MMSLTMTSEREQIHPRRLVWDGTINAGHVLTFLSMMAIVVVQWNILDKRVTVLEREVTYQRERDAVQNDALREAVLDLKTAVRELKGTVDQLHRENRQ